MSPWHTDCRFIPNRSPVWIQPPHVLKFSTELVSLLQFYASHESRAWKWNSFLLVSWPTGTNRMPIRGQSASFADRTLPGTVSLHKVVSRKKEISWISCRVCPDRQEIEEVKQVERWWLRAAEPPSHQKPHWAARGMNCWQALLVNSFFSCFEDVFNLAVSLKCQQPNLLTRSVL